MQKNNTIIPQLLVYSLIITLLTATLHLPLTAHNPNAHLIAAQEMAKEEWQKAEEKSGSAQDVLRIEVRRGARGAAATLLYVMGALSWSDRYHYRRQYISQGTVGGFCAYQVAKHLTDKYNVTAPLEIGKTYAFTAAGAVGLYMVTEAAYLIKDKDMNNIDHRIYTNMRLLWYHTLASMVCNALLQRVVEYATDYFYPPKPEPTERQ